MATTQHRLRGGPHPGGRVVPIPDYGVVPTPNIRWYRGGDYAWYSLTRRPTLKRLLDGSPYHELIAGAAINLGRMYAEIGNLGEARLLFQEAEALCRKYNLPHLRQATESLRQVNRQIGLRKPPELTIEQLVAELFDLVDWFPEAGDSLLRLWMYGRADDVVANLRGTLGVKLMVCEDDVSAFVDLADALHPYVSVCLQAVSSEYPGAGMDMVPFPPDKPMFFDPAVPVVENQHFVRFLRGSMRSRYTLVSGRLQSKITGNEGCIIMGWSPGLPKQAHDLILSRSAAELLERKVFFLPYERHLADDKVASDIRLCKQLAMLPAYPQALPDSESVGVVTSMKTDLPVLSPDEVRDKARWVGEIRRQLARLPSITGESARSQLADLEFAVHDLRSSVPSAEHFPVQVLVLDYRGVLEKEVYAVMVSRQ